LPAGPEIAGNRNGRRAKASREERLFEGRKTLKGESQERLDLKEDPEAREE
jgi:hypothetical protein